MILFVGNRIKLGGLAEVVENRLNKTADFVDEAISIKRQENEILKNAPGAEYIIYDTEQYLDDAEDIVEIIKRIHRAGAAKQAKPILLVPTNNPNNEILKNAVDAQIKLVVNTALSLGEQKDQLEKIYYEFYDGNEREDIAAVEEVVNEKHHKIEDMLYDMYDAKQREEKREKTVIVKKKGTTEVILYYSIKVLKDLCLVALVLLAGVGAFTLLYSELRSEFLTQLNYAISQIF